MTQHAESSSHCVLPVAAARRHSFTCAGILYHCMGDWQDDQELTMPDTDSDWPWLQQLQWFVQLKNFQQKNRIKTQQEYLLLRIFQDQQLVVVLPLMSANQQRTLVALSNYYSPEFKPLQSVDAGICNDKLWPILLAAMSTLWPKWQQLTLHPLSATTAAQIQQHCPAHVATLESNVGHNWRAFATSNTGYWQNRQSQLVNTIRRKKKKLLQLGADIQIHRQLTPELIAAYWYIYQRSWKQAEPSTDFINWLLQFASEQGQLRLGLLRIDGVAVAFQFWLVQQQQAAIVKLSQDQAFDALSPGTVLMAAMIDEVMTQDGVTTLDFLTGNDDYKEQWMDQCLPLLQLDLYNCQHLRGRIGYLKSNLAKRLSALRQLWRDRDQPTTPSQLPPVLRQADD
jgi:hypothetical protein